LKFLLVDAVALLNVMRATKKAVGQFCTHENERPLVPKKSKYRGVLADRQAAITVGWIKEFRDVFFALCRCLRCRRLIHFIPAAGSSEK
jgi:hypothetical protein